MLRKPKVFHVYTTADLIIIKPPYKERYELLKFVRLGHINYPYVEIGEYGLLECGSDPGMYLYEELENGNIHAYYDEQLAYINQINILRLIRAATNETLKSKNF